MENFDRVSGLFTHEAKSHPFGGYLMRDGGNPFVNGPLRDLISEWVDEEYYEIFKLSLTDFLDLPIPYLTIIRDLKVTIKERRKKQGLDHERQMKKFNDMMKG